MNYSTQHAFIRGERSSLAESLSPQMWERLFSREFSRVDQTTLALCRKGLVLCGSLTALGDSLLAVEWRDAEANVLCPKCWEAATYVRTRYFEDGNALVYRCVNQACRAHDNYFHVRESVKAVQP